MFKRPLFKEFVSLSALLTILHLLAVNFSFYWSITEFDSLVHFIGGLLVSTLFLWFYFHSGIFMPETRKIVQHFLIAMLGTLFISVAWEIFEVVEGIAVLSWSEYASDTSLDLVMDLLGAAVACLYAYNLELKERRQFDQSSFLETEKLIGMLEAVQQDAN